MKLATFLTCLLVFTASFLTADERTFYKNQKFEPRYWLSDRSYQDFMTDMTPPPKHAPDPDDGTKYFFGQWFLGPLLMPSPGTADPKHPCVEPGVTLLSTYGNYNNDWNIDAQTPKVWSMNYLIYSQFGITKHWGFELIAGATSNYQNGVHPSTQFNDTIFRFGYQVTNDKHEKGNWTPDFRIIFEEQFPTGPFRDLDPDKNGLDVGGLGSFVTGGWLAAMKGFAWDTNHAFDIGVAIGYFLQSSMKLTGFNAYGGDHFTRGRAYPGNLLSVYLSGEFEITNHLGVAFDSNYQQIFKGYFRGKQGNGDPVALPQNVWFQLAIPEVEVIINEQAGFLFGPWFTFSGQNTPAFWAFFIDFLYIF